MLLGPPFLPSSCLPITIIPCVPILHGPGAGTGPIGSRLSEQTPKCLFSILKTHHGYRKNNSDRAHTPQTRNLHITQVETEQTFKTLGSHHLFLAFPLRGLQEDPIIGPLFLTSSSVRCGQLVGTLRMWESIGIQVFICDM